MVAANSEMLPLGTQAPTFALPGADGNTYALNDTTSEKAVLVMFICNHCPFVKLLRDELASIGRDYLPNDVAIFAINSNDANAYPADSPARMLDEARSWGYQFPYLVDADQSVAKAYRAACTPDFFLFDGNHSLVYRGQLDDSRPGNGRPVTGRDLRAALDAVLAKRPVVENQIPSVGCSIKWIAGEEPAWFG